MKFQYLVRMEVRGRIVRVAIHALTVSPTNPTAVFTLYAALGRPMRLALRFSSRNRRRPQQIPAPCTPASPLRLDRRTLFQQVVRIPALLTRNRVDDCIGAPAAVHSLLVSPPGLVTTRSAAAINSWITSVNLHDVPAMGAAGRDPASCSAGLVLPADGDQLNRRIQRQQRLMHPLDRSNAKPPASWSTTGRSPERLCRLQTIRRERGAC